MGRLGWNNSRGGLLIGLGNPEYLLEEVALVPEQLKKIPLQAQRDLFLLLSRFMLFYNLDNKLESFLKQFPDFPTAFFVGGPADIFVIELTDQLQKLKVEPVLLHYLSQIKVLQGNSISTTDSMDMNIGTRLSLQFSKPNNGFAHKLDAGYKSALLTLLYMSIKLQIDLKLLLLLPQGLALRMTTSTRLKTCLYSFTSPGGPMYPTRAVRHAAWDALDFLFPVGRYPRHLISLFFRLLYPWYWPSSCWNFIKACMQAILYSILSLIFSVWEKLGKAKDS
ncbi:hypothetical protein TEA_017128 [Camellia sinensis var. sinensis]|uniref:Uncharacterized protein n=1 Tax=Camellia sinensis var. sinensis TaxID=542762 RepID=A0A4S4E601_CAMSN|nr:hypothetical protein TEA_017128 [Camellia sinensis var. sinensis]